MDTETNDTPNISPPRTITVAVKNFISVFFQGIWEGICILKSITILFKSRRARKLLKDGYPLWILHFIMNMYLYYILPLVTEHQTLWYTYLTYASVWAMWNIPVYVISSILQFTYFNRWMKDVYKNKYKINNTGNTLTSLAEVLYGNLLLFCYLVQIELVCYMISIRWLSLIYAQIHYAWMVSFNIIEYKLIYAGHPLFKRIAFFENRWIYFLGLGLPLSFLYSMVPFSIIVGAYPIFLGLLVLQSVQLNPKRLYSDQNVRIVKETNLSFQIHQTSLFERLPIFYFSHKIATVILNRFYYFLKPLKKNTKNQVKTKKDL